VHSGPLGCLTNSGVKQAVLVQNFVPRSRVGIFHNELYRSTLLDRKLMFWCVSNYLDAFGTVWLAYKTRCKTCRTGAKVRARKSHRNFSQRTHKSTQLEPKLTFWCVSYYLRAFGTAWLPYEFRCKTVRTSAIFRATKSRWTFSQRTHPIHPIGP
jgi:hypothetical protein